MLFTVIPLKRDLAFLENKIFIETSIATSTKFIYLFYGDTAFEYVRFEPENLMMQTREGPMDIFIPKKCGADVDDKENHKI